jgi:hypothetical protein
MRPLADVISEWWKAEKRGGTPVPESTVVTPKGKLVTREDIRRAVDDAAIVPSQLPRATRFWLGDESGPWNICWHINGTVNLADALCRFLGIE